MASTAPGPRDSQQPSNSMRPLETDRQTVELVTVDASGVVREGPVDQPGAAIGLTFARLRDEFGERLTPELQVRVVLEVLRALQPVHTNLLRPPQQRCHGTLHPGCIVLNDEGTLSLFWQPMTRPSEQERPYLAPEVRGGSEPDQQADLYSVGLMLYEAVTGRRVTSAAPDRNLPTIAPWAEPLLDVAIEALYRLPRRRWASALAFAEGITAVAGSRVASRSALAELVQAVASPAITEAPDSGKRAVSSPDALAPSSVGSVSAGSGSSSTSSSAASISGELVAVAEPSVSPPARWVPPPRHSGMWFSARRTPGFAWVGLSVAAVLCALLIGFRLGTQTEQVPIVTAIGLSNEWQAEGAQVAGSGTHASAGDTLPAGAHTPTPTPLNRAPSVPPQLTAPPVAAAEQPAGNRAARAANSPSVGADSSFRASDGASRASDGTESLKPPIPAASKTGRGSYDPEGI